MTAINSGGRGPGFATLALHGGSSSVRPEMQVPVEIALFEERVALLEGGTEAVAFASGLAAQLSVLHALLDGGDELLVSATVLAEPSGAVAAASAEFGWRLRACDLASPDSFAAAISPATKAILVESLNLAADLADLTALAAVADGAALPLVVDNTLATPAQVRPLDRGAHIVLHAGLAGLAGHGAAPGGIVVDGGTYDWMTAGKMARPHPGLEGRSIGERFGNFAFAASLRMTSLRALAGPPDHRDMALALAGLGTLALRAERQGHQATVLARHLESNPAVAAVRHHGPLLHLNLTAAIDRLAFAGSAQLLSVGPPGGTQSTIVDAAGLAATSLVLFIGLEDPDDLAADLDQALAANRA